MRRYAFVLFAILVAGYAGATTYNSPQIDGTVSVSPSDWDEDEFLLDDANEDSRYHEADIDDIYVTWDSTNFYIGVKTNLAPGGYGNGYVVFIDTDAHLASITGATDFTNANFYPRHITFSGMGADIVIGGWSFQMPFDVRYCSDPTNAQSIPDFVSAFNPGMRSFEVMIPWSRIYPDAEGVVDEGAAMRIVAVSVGNDNSGAYDAAPNSSHDADGDGVPDENDTDLHWDDYTDLDRFLEITIDVDNDGIPDENFPPSGYIAGTISFDDPHDTQTVATIDAYLSGDLVASVTAPPGGGAYRLERLVDGSYDLEVHAFSYRAQRREGIVIDEGVGVDSVDFILNKVPGAVIGTVTVEGPQADVTVYTVDVSTGAISGDGVHKIEGGSGSFEILAIEDGIHHLIAEARGYVRFDSLITIEADTAWVDIQLRKAIATRYVFLDSAGIAIKAVRISRSLPSDGGTAGFSDFADLRFEPRDDYDNAAIFDESAIDSVKVSATLLDVTVLPRGHVVFADTSGESLADSLILRSMFTDGIGRFFVSDDSVEVLRVEVLRGEVRGAIEVGVGELKPVRVRLTADTTEIAVGGREKIEVEVQLLDASGNPAPTPDVAIRLLAVEGNPIFEPELDVTNANGLFISYLSGFEAGRVRFTASVEPGEYAGLPADTVEVYLRPGHPDRIRSELSPRTVKLGGTAIATFQVVDSYGNAVKLENLRIDLSATPAELISSIMTPIFTDTSGFAASQVAVDDRYGIVRIEPAADYPVDALDLAIDSRLVSTDETAPESDTAHNSNPDVDLTTMFAWLEPNTMVVMLDFSSSWDGVHLMVAIEVNGDADGGNQDPFQFPIYYRHQLKPDYVFTYKYSSNDYADLRKWEGNRWKFWQLVNRDWTIDESDPDKNAVGLVEKSDTQVFFKFPLAAIGDLSPGDTLRIQAYVTQEAFGTKYNALDSNPQDATHDMEPDEGEWWETATRPMNLSGYAEYVFPLPGKAPGIRSAQAMPAVASTNDKVIFSVEVVDSGGGIGDVLVDLSPVGGESFTRLYDDGTNGDETAGDRVYSVEFKIPDVVSQGIQVIKFTAKDSLNVSEATAVTTLEIINPPEVIISVVDSIGDDHGPNMTDPSGNPVDGLYYIYPTNGVFSPGVFDIEQVDFMIVGGFLVIRIHVGDVPSSDAVGWNAPYPDATCLNPNKADLNLQKIDIYIDSKEGSGATAGLPFRYVDIARSDAWEYAVAIEGWWRGLIVSNGENSISFWTILRQTNQINFCTDYIEDFIDVWIGLSVLGDPTPEEIKKWDFIITMASHDGNSDDQNLGGIRWVNNATSEWQFGNGRDGEAGRERDANIIDVVAVPGEGKQPGRTQEEMLNYLAPEAIRRFDNGLTACILEATSSLDISPPVIEPFPTNGFAHAVWYILEHAPVSFWTLITDENMVEEAEFRWRPLGSSQWNSTEMVKISGDYWIADIDPDEFQSAIQPTELVDGTPARPFEARIRAVDGDGNESQTPLITFAVPDVPLQYDTRGGLRPGQSVIFYDGTIVSLPEEMSPASSDSFSVTLIPLSETGPEAIDLTNLRSTMTYLGVARDIVVTCWKDDFEESLAQLGQPVSLSLHYPTYLADLDENKIGIFRFNEVTDRWISIFGSVNRFGNAVTAEVDAVGRYGLFADNRLSYDTSEGLSGVRAEPNPFSPNGDGVYDETHISFFLSREADWVTIEIFDISGEDVRTIRWQRGLTSVGRNAFDIVWDGRDDNGEIVPYGIYILRVEVRFKVAPYNERQNIAVAVIK